MATISNTPRPGYVWDSTDNVWYPIGVGGHSHPDYITQATAVNPTIIDAKGDIITATAADTPARLAVGNNGETLVADSSASSGLRYQSNFAAGKNKIINGDTNIWQRGTSITIPNGTWTYHCDRFSAYETYSAGSLVVSRQAFTPGTAPVAGYEGNYFMRFTAPTTGTGGLQFRQLIENVTTFAGQTVTVSFWAKASSALTLYSFASQRFGSGGSADVDSGSNPHSITTSWTRFSYSWTLPSIAGKTIGTGSALDAYFYTSANFTAGATLDIWGVQLEAGSVATAFQTATGTLQGELAACQRYYYQYVSGTDLNIGAGTLTSAGTLLAYVNFPVTMRTTPTLVASSGVNYYTGESAGVNDVFNSFTITRAHTNSAAIYNSTEIAGTSGYSSFVRTSNASASIAFNGEL